MALLVALMTVPPLCAVLLIAYRIWPREALFGPVALMWLVLIALAFADLVFLAVLGSTADPGAGWNAIGAGLLEIYSLPLLISGALALFIRPPAPADGDRW